MQRPTTPAITPRQATHVIDQLHDEITTIEHPLATLRDHRSK